MENKKIAKILASIGQYLSVQNIPFKPQAYQKAAASLEILPLDVRKLYAQKGIRGLEEIPGIGRSLALKIEEYLKTGRIKYYEQLKKQLPVDIYQLTQVEGIGPQTVKRLYQALGIKNLNDLEKAARAKKIRDLPGFGPRSEANILREITIFREQHQRFCLGKIFPIAQDIEKRLGKLTEVKKISLAGSIRRRKETIGDVDILVASSQPRKVMKAFTSFPSIVKVWGVGLTKSSVRLKEGFDIDLRIVREENWGAALQYFTGSKQHNIVLRKWAIKRGLKLNEYGVFKGSQRLAGKTEEEFYQTLGMDWIPPEIRTNTGEIEAALLHHLPQLVDYRSLQGDLHVYSCWGEGEASIEEMARSAQKQGYHYLAIADRLKAKTPALLRRKLINQMKEIDKLNRKLSGIKILKGIELGILKDGRLNFNDPILGKLDLVVVAVHSSFQLPRKEMTKRILKVLDYPFVSLLAHPGNRILQKREMSDLDWDQVFAKAKQAHVLLEINSQPYRLDLTDENIRRAKEKGVKMVINSEARTILDFKQNEFGIAQARRGWASPSDILNTQAWSKIRTYLSQNES